MKSNINKALVLACCMLVIFSSDGFAQLRRTHADIRSLMKEYDAVGLSVAVVKDNKMVFKRSYGLKDIDSRQPLKTNDLFRIASISKSFSATAIMQLVEAGKISLDDDVSNLIGFKVRNPSFPEVAITLRMIMSHTSSINDSQGYFNLDVINPATNPEFSACYSNYPPGGGYRYCNLNFNMTGAIIEKISGERFDQYILNHILKPLKLYGGYCIDSLDASLFATLYEYDSTSGKYSAAPEAYNPRRDEIARYRRGYSTPIFSPTGGMKISAKDLAIYMQMHMNLGAYSKGSIISANSARQMQTPVNGAGNYGLALLHTDRFIPGKMLTGHTGLAYGLHSAMFFSPEEKFGIVLITNGCNAADSDGSNPFLKAVAQVLYRKYIE